MNYSAAKHFILTKLEHELSPDLAYHGLHHTKDVLQVTTDLCIQENVSEKDTILLKTAALFHDSGFTISNVNHEETGCQIVKDNLPRFGYSDEDIEKICGMIMATKIPQSPKNRLEEILADADLDYLGRNDFYKIGATLFEELKTFNVIDNEEAWNRIQVKFLEAHHFFTKTNISLRKPKKMQYLNELRGLVKEIE